MNKLQKQFLDNLRNSGAVNMFSVRPDLMKKFNLDKKQAGDVLSQWMSSFN